MRINSITPHNTRTYNPNFKAEFKKNDDFKEFINMAEKGVKLVHLNSALTKLKKIYPYVELELAKEEGSNKKPYYSIRNVTDAQFFGYEAMAFDVSKVIEKIDRLSNPTSQEANNIFHYSAKRELDYRFRNDL